MVVATHEGPPGWDGPRILYYGHYDVQPPDPLALWTSPPFEPTIVDGPKGKRVVARGAVDDKGQVMTFIEAFRAWRDVHGTLPCPVTVLLEGEEESGSASLEPFLKAHSKMLAADVCVVSDTGMWDIDTPAVTTMLRGLVYVEITVHGPTRDLHSGMYGGAVPNPCNVLASIIAQLHDANRVVQIPGFYDDVREVSAAVKGQWSKLDFPEGEFLGDIGLKAGFGESGRSTLERTWSRPTCDVNGFWGGYTGAGAKTVIASHASAKLSCRLVAEQDPAKVLAGIRAFVRRGCLQAAATSSASLGPHLHSACATTTPSWARRSARSRECSGAMRRSSAPAAAFPRWARSASTRARTRCLWDLASMTTACTRPTRSSSCGASSTARSRTPRCSTSLA